MSAPLRCAVIICSDRASSGERPDETFGPLAARLQEAGLHCSPPCVVPDERSAIQDAVRRLAAQCDVLFTSGGTGIGSRDVTVEATRELFDRELPGIGEAMRARSLAITPMAMLSRATAGTFGRVLIVNLPGSPRGAVECAEVVLPVLRHVRQLLGGDAADCKEARNSP